MVKRIEEFDAGIKIKAIIREHVNGIMFINLTTEHDGRKYVWPMELILQEWESQKKSHVEKFSIDVLSGMAYNLEVDPN